jgi:hypothetical protein
MSAVHRKAEDRPWCPHFWFSCSEDSIEAVLLAYSAMYVVNFLLGFVQSICLFFIFFGSCIFCFCFCFPMQCIVKCTYGLQVLQHVVPHMTCTQLDYSVPVVLMFLFQSEGRICKAKFEVCFW